MGGDSVAVLGIVAIFAALVVGAGLVGLVAYLDYRQRRDVLAPPAVHYHIGTMNTLQLPPAESHSELPPVVRYGWDEQVRLLPRGRR